MGDSRTPFIFVSVACVTNIFLDLLFVAVFGWAATGAAAATVISQALSVILCIIYMTKKNFHFDFKPSSFRIDKEQLRLMFKIGFPTSIQNTVVSLSFLFITVIVNVVGGVYASAAVGAVGKFNSFAFMPTFAISMSVSTMCAQNIGAGRIDRAVRAVKYGLVVAVIINYLFFAVVQIFPESVLAIFGDEPEMIQLGVEYLRTFCFDFLLVPFIFCINSLYTGGGHTTFTLISSMLSSVLLRVPISYIFGSVMGLGLRGIGMGAPAASAGALLLILGFLISGKWKENVVKHNKTAVAAAE
jgi:putative MATE family efflux protein